jgi:hypothetical protein
LKWKGGVGGKGGVIDPFVVVRTLSLGSKTQTHTHIGIDK